MSTRNDCVFKNTKQLKCEFPGKSYGYCFLCNKYLPNSGDLDDRLKYMNYVVQRINNKKSLYISVIAMSISVGALIINFLRLKGN